MSDTEFTAGAWSYTYGTKDERYKYDPSAANAHLIAAAPDMYEALESLVKHLDDEDALTDLREAGWGYKMIGELKETITKSGAALSKAQGGE
jgi:hypothetical protein